MIYNFNLGIGWASSGVEYAQAYRAKLLRSIGADAKFIFTDMFPRDNIEHMTKNIGFLDSEVIGTTHFPEMARPQNMYSPEAIIFIRSIWWMRQVIWSTGWRWSPTDV